MIKWALKRLLLHSEVAGLPLLEFIAVWAIYWGDYITYGKDSAVDVRLLKTW